MSTPPTSTPASPPETLVTDKGLGPRRPPRTRTRTRKTTKTPRESTIEKYFVQTMRAKGALVMKFVSPGTIGVPDRLVVHRGRHVFVELKRPGGTPEPHQVQRMDQMRRHGATCLVISTKAEVDAFAETLDD